MQVRSLLPAPYDEVPKSGLREQTANLLIAGSNPALVSNLMFPQTHSRIAYRFRRPALTRGKMVQLHLRLPYGGVSERLMVLALKARSRKIRGFESHPLRHIAVDLSSAAFFYKSARSM